MTSDLTINGWSYGAKLIRAEHPPMAEVRQLGYFVTDDEIADAERIMRRLKQECDEAMADAETLREILRDAMPILLREYGARGLGSRAAVALMAKEAGDGE